MPYIAQDEKQPLFRPECFPGIVLRGRGPADESQADAEREGYEEAQPQRALQFRIDLMPEPANARVSDPGNCNDRDDQRARIEHRFRIPDMKQQGENVRRDVKMNRRPVAWERADCDDPKQYDMKNQEILGAWSEEWANDDATEDNGQ
ncbi:MAG TPA: hypothetical protein VF203_03955 [Burkholderiales bacterium]